MVACGERADVARWDRTTGEIDLGGRWNRSEVRKGCARLQAGEYTGGIYAGWPERECKSHKGAFSGARYASEMTLERAATEAACNKEVRQSAMVVVES